MQWYFVVLIVLGALCGVYVVFAYLLGRKLLQLATRPVVHGLDEAREVQAQTEGLSFDEYDNVWRKQPFEIVGVHGKLRGEVIFNPSSEQARRRVAIVCHGHTWNRINSVKYAKIFYDKGYNVVLYDHAYFGLSDGKYTTLGHNECRDLGFVISYAKSLFGEDAIVALHGESMGAATVLGALAVTKDVDMVVADCPFSDTMKYYRELCTQMTHLPSFPIVDFANAVSKRKYGYDFARYKPIDCVRASTIPICFVHGRADDFISCHYSSDMFEVSSNKLSELHLVDGAAHAESYKTSPEKYKNIICDFIDKVEQTLE